VGVSLVVPLGFREGRGERDRLRGEAGRAEERVRAAVRLLEEAVREAHRKLVHGSQRLQASREGMEAAQEQVRIGFIEYRNGRSTAFELVRLGADLAASQKRYSESLVRTARAAAELKRLTAGVYDASARNRNGS
jgi:outer membrane protein TolC